MPMPPNNCREFKSFVEIVQALRGPDGCPWDKKQSHSTLTQYAIEEAHELVEAIENGSTSDIKEELGDVLLQVVLHSEIARQSGSFDIQDVIETISQKMVRRHPHVFGNAQATTQEEIKANWEKIKTAEKRAKLRETNDPSSSPVETEGVGRLANPFENIPRGLPALQRSQKIGSKTVRYNFDWSSPDDVFAKLEEEITELKEAYKQKNKSEQEKELGDVLFTVAQLARHLELDAEKALRLGNSKFETRFLKMRQLIADDQRDYASLSTNELEVYWQKAKIFEKL